MHDLSDMNNKPIDLSISAFDHTEPETDDCGLPENPIFSDYSKYLWKGHIRSGGIQANKRSRKSTEINR
jgi:hypothetical protein